MRAFLVLLFAADVLAQTCQLSVAGLNRNRRVIGNVNVECPGGNPLHTPPFGNWGVTSNFGQKFDGHQFDGWCHDTPVCDAAGNCRTECRDGWYEWNSCTDHFLFRAPNCTLYNGESCQQQVTTTGVNVHGTRAVNLPASCPSDANGDGIAESGGCTAVTSYSTGVSFMTLYELDPAGGDELVQTMYFPEATLPLRCGIFGCLSEGTAWLQPIRYDSPVSPPRVSAEMAAVVNHAVFLDTAGACRVAVASAPTVSAASFRAGGLAPNSIASSFAPGFTPETVSATSTPLPTAMGGVSVSVADSNGILRPAPLFFVSPSQINWLVPEGTARGPASVTIVRSATIRWTDRTQIESIAPALFSANGSGSGVAAAVALTVASNGTQQSRTIFECPAGAGSCQPVPLSMGGAGDRIYLLLFGTGIRGASSPAAVTMRIGGVVAPLLYAGPQGQYVGLDQINALVPRTLAGRGDVEIQLTADGREANPVRVTLAN
ncbi:MAG: hypothetical protein WD696_12155 [Bryobacteraceae bacterium]